MIDCFPDVSFEQNYEEYTTQRDLFNMAASEAGRDVE